ncbi:MAG TPA: glycosyltransferase family 39 protein [Acidobacteriaceae bacterium]|nr:glycosyltransferase family 39 protein [Acidobacteriaceae bacterium]
MTTVVMASVLLAFIALIVSFTRGYVLLYGDAVAHLGIARRIVDSRNPGLVQLGGVWLPLPHLLMLPLIWKMEWWRSGLAGTWPSLAFYMLGVAGFYRLCRRMMVPRWALVAAAFYAVNPNLLYLATTAMTEPLFLALVIWLTLVTMECVEAIRKGEEKRAERRMIALGLLILAAVFTRYDGWILGAAAWCVIAWQLTRAKETLRRTSLPFAIFTVLAIAGPLLWFWYNHHFFHDWLDFMRGPYSAPAIEKRTSPPGSRHYRGWHNLGWALLFYTRTAQVVAAAWETGFAVMLVAVAGLWIALRKRVERALLLLWVPLPFYVYSVAYGSVPIFIPQLWPHSYYNARYGMEMLPALALFACIACAAVEQGLKVRTERKMLASRPANPAANTAATAPIFVTFIVVLVMLNPVAMIFGPDVVQKLAGAIERHPSHLLADYAPPLVLKEALVNSSTRVPFERDLALVLQEMPPGAQILMQESDHIGALQDAGIPLKQTINETDYDSWHVALEDPAGHAQFVVAMEGDAVAKAVAAHPQDLEELDILCTTGQPCARIYRSLSYGEKTLRSRRNAAAAGAQAGSPAK